MTQNSTLLNPFVGLRPYQSSDSLFYFGRNEQTKTLFRLLHQHRFVAVVGSSGAGKSSLVRAGLIPQLEAGFLVQERDQWLVATAKPGDAPLANLVESLLELTEKDSDSTTHAEQCQQLTADIEEHGTQALIDQLGPRFTDSDCNLFILVDQFEELFRFGLEKGQTAKRQQAEQFVALLLNLSRHDLPIYVCLTMRSDFLGDCDAFYGLPEAINKSQFLVPRLTRGQRQEVITHPVNLAGARIAPRLVDRLLNESIDTRDDLPVLQHVLMRTWDVWQESGGEGALDIEHYEKAHTIHHALDRHADEALEELDDEQKQIAKVLFQALTTVDQGNRSIRRPAHLHEVSTIANCSPEAVIEVIDCFREQNRSFLAISFDAAGNDPLIDISHESLLRQWKKIITWIDAEKESVKTFRRLAETASLHSQGKANLYTGNELIDAKKWYQRFPNELALSFWTERYLKDSQYYLPFLNESIDKSNKDEFRRDNEFRRRVELLSKWSNTIRRKQTLATVLVTLLTLTLLGASFLFLSDRNIKQTLLKKYETAAEKIIIRLPLFEGDSLIKSSELLSTIDKLKLSSGFDDDLTENEYFAYLEKADSKELLWFSKFPSIEQKSVAVATHLDGLVTHFPAHKPSRESTFEITEAQAFNGQMLEFFVFSKEFNANQQKFRLVLAESSMKYRNQWNNTSLTMAILFISTLILILTSHLISARLMKSPIKDFEDEIKSIINQGK